MIVIRRGKEPNSLLKFRKVNPDADYETDMPTDVLKDIREQMWEEQDHEKMQRKIAGCVYARTETYICNSGRGTEFDTILWNYYFLA